MWILFKGSQNLGGKLNECIFRYRCSSVSSNFSVIVDEDLQVLDAIYLRTQRKPLEIIKTGLMQIYTRLSKNQRISGVGTTGSGRQLAALVVGADVAKNEITAHAVAAAHSVPDVHTVLEIWTRFK